MPTSAEVEGFRWLYENGNDELAEEIYETLAPWVTGWQPGCPYTVEHQGTHHCYRLAGHPGFHAYVARHQRDNQTGRVFSTWFDNSPV